MVTFAAVVATATIGCGGDSKDAKTVARQADSISAPDLTTVVPNVPAVPPAEGETPPATTEGAAAPAGAPAPVPPSAQDIQNVIASITSQVLAPADTTAGTAPLTKEEIMAEVRAQLKLLGIEY